MLVAGCGGGGGSGSSTATPPAAPALELLVGLPITGYTSVDGTGTDARFNLPTGIVSDPVGVLYVADSRASAIRKVTPTGVVTTFAGTLGVSGFADGVGAAARFGGPSGIYQGIGGLAMDGVGNIYVADGGSNRIRKITAQGVVTTLAGGAAAGSTDGPGSEARFDVPAAIAVDAQGNLYVGEAGKPRIRKISPAGMVTTIAGGSESGHVDGPASSARFGLIAGFAIDTAGNLYIADATNYAIRKLGIDGNVTTVRGGIGNSTMLVAHAVAVDDAGVLYVGGGGLQKILPSGAMSTIAYGGPAGIALTKDGRVYYADYVNNAVFEISAAGAVTQLAGVAPGAQAQIDGTGAAARFQDIRAMAANTAGDLHIIDAGSIRKVTRGGIVTTRLTGLESLGIAGIAADEADATYYALWTYCGMIPGPGCTTHSTLEKLTAGGQRIPMVPTTSTDGSPLTSFRINGLTRDGGGDLYFSDERILKLDAGGNLTTIAGGPPGHIDGIGTIARFFLPTGLALDRAGNLYVADTNNHSIRKITPARIVTTLVAGPNLAGAVNAGLKSPLGVAVDDSGNVYVADSGNYVVRKVTPTGAISIVTGQLGHPGFASGALPGSLDTPIAVAVVGTDLYIAMPTGIAVVHNRP